jgi:hypothetical protein
MSHPPGTSTTYGVAKPRFETPDLHEGPATEFILWLNQQLDVLSDTPPNQAEWDAIRGRIAEEVGSIVARRIQHKARFDYGVIAVDSLDQKIADNKLKIEQAKIKTELYMAQVRAFEERLRAEAVLMVHGLNRETF